jgi:hypothetical protein
MAHREHSMDPAHRGPILCVSVGHACVRKAQSCTLTATVCSSVTGRARTGPCSTTDSASWSSSACLESKSELQMARGQHCNAAVSVYRALHARQRQTSTVACSFSRAREEVRCLCFANLLRMRILPDRTPCSRRTLPRPCQTTSKHQQTRAIFSQPLREGGCGGRGEQGDYNRNTDGLCSASRKSLEASITSRLAQGLPMPLVIDALDEPHYLEDEHSMAWAVALFVSDLSP